ncbi:MULTISPECIES: MAPEG family protein [unclassified Achromobacter]|uniref:MAPEG family protein n=1 Tax=unclassified Achromobacter TaxID=2626865 RepID=UPI000B515619|nr:MULTISPECIES: MAPEG family protein [unclassified Achromobacter]OWT80302.1 hypothetical protein CEY05_02500 [Achromobacter sp. HZ34]OWT82185.1 hypothetical protein CEY04_02500 [Achromobacter sp. HZ28]
MSIQLTLLAWTLVLALVQILAAAQARTRETGLAWNAGPRDAASVPVGKLAGRLKRAQGNLLETLPVFAAAILIAHVAGRESALSAAGAWTYLIARVVYVPLYAAGIPYVRSLAWVVSIIGILLVLVPLL